MIHFQARTVTSIEITRCRNARRTKCCTRVPVARQLCTTSQSPEPREHRRSACNSKETDFEMIKFYFAAILLTLFSSTYAVADDYLLRLETVGLRDLPNGDQEPDSGIRESIEIVVRKITIRFTVAPQLASTRSLFAA